MFKKAIESVFILPVIVILGVILNFKSFLYDFNLSWFEVGVSSAYLIIWIINFKSALKNKKYKLILVLTIFWIITFITSSIGLYINFNPHHTIFDILLIFLFFIFLTPLFGFKFVIEQIIISRYIIFILFLIISFIFSVFGLKFLIAQRKNRI